MQTLLHKAGTSPGGSTSVAMQIADIDTQAQRKFRIGGPLRLELRNRLHLHTDADCCCQKIDFCKSKFVPLMSEYGSQKIQTPNARYRQDLSSAAGYLDNLLGRWIPPF